MPGAQPLGIVAGRGDLPRLLAEECRRTGRDYVVVLFAGQNPDWAADHPTQAAEFEKPARLFKALKKQGVECVSFAGGMDRPDLKPLKFDWKLIKLAPSLMPALKQGDDATLRMITQIFEREGFKIEAAHDVLTSLLAPAGVLTQAKISKSDWADIRRGFELAEGLGRLDVGQGAVVAGGICLGLESIQGTDAMLKFVADTREGLRQKRPAGVLCKCPKPGQDWRVDLPAIGPDTVKAAAEAGLAGVAVRTGGVLILGLEETIAVANDLGLFLIGVAGGEAP